MARAAAIGSRSPAGQYSPAERWRYGDILIAIAIITNGEKRISALQLSRELGVSYKTALDLAHQDSSAQHRARRVVNLRDRSSIALVSPRFEMKAVKFCP